MKNKERRKNQKLKVSEKVYMAFYEDGPHIWQFGYTKGDLIKLIRRTMFSKARLENVEIKRVLLRVDVL